MEFTIILIILVLAVVSCDLSQLTLTENEVQLLYREDTAEEPDEPDAVFGTRTMETQVDLSDLCDADIASQAEDLLERIYNK